MYENLLYFNVSEWYKKQASDCKSRKQGKKSWERWSDVTQINFDTLKDYLFISNQIHSLGQDDC